ncbi:MAG: type II toxin-antitoxin system VapC family toxin [Solirubrobacterales bacterium]|nr:type II toxin-antitoxin system VapC family toxin [Solirubrobacterales bacterium]OJU94437.1 MAG: VapC toxin family PIN domain ribonuclease [Solirubrobacterales bacterium 67-14]
MTKEEGLLDTSVVILLGKAAPSTLPRIPFISTVTLAELAVGPLVAKDESERLERQARLLQAEADFDPIPFDDQAARTFGTVSANLRGKGRKSAARSFDAMIAATAISRGLPLFTANPGDFEGIDSLVVRQV